MRPFASVMVHLKIYKVSIYLPLRSLQLPAQTTLPNTETLTI